MVVVGPRPFAFFFFALAWQLLACGLSESFAERWTASFAMTVVYLGADLQKHFARAALLQRFLAQPFHVAEAFTGTPGVYVKLEDTIRAFRELVAGDHDDLPEQALYMVGTIEEAQQKARKMAA